MARYTGPTHRISRRAGSNLTEARSRSNAGCGRPGAHGRKRQPRKSEYVKQLREKQTLVQYFGMTEGQFQHTFEQAMSSPELTGEHGHVFVNRRKVDIPPYRVSPGNGSP